MDEVDLGVIFRRRGVVMKVGSTVFEGTVPECDESGVGGDHRRVRPP